jgi:hypothetical protein
MRNPALGILLLWLAGVSFGQTEQALCPRHIEAPEYPPIARTAHLSGSVTLIVTIDQDGNVKSAEAVTGESITQVPTPLRKYAAENMMHWTFAKPASAPHAQTFVYDYELDTSLPPEGGKKSTPAITRVSFDLPNRVTIATNLRFIDTSESRKQN